MPLLLLRGPRSYTLCSSWSTYLGIRGTWEKCRISGPALANKVRIRSVTKSPGHSDVNSSLGNTSLESMNCQSCPEGLDGLNDDPPPKTFVHIQIPGTCECDLIWKKRVFAGIIKELEMRSSWITWCALITRCVLRREAEGDLRQTEEDRAM